MAENILSYSFKAYRENIKLISFFSIPSLIAFLIPAMVNTPVFSALGGSFLRTGSIPDMSGSDLGIVICGVLISLYLMSFAIVNIKSFFSRRTPIFSSVLDGIQVYSLPVSTSTRATETA